MHYLDNAATTAVLPEVIQAIGEVMEQHFANPSSLYRPGFEAEKQIQAARATVAKALGCQPGEVVFTASGTEASNIAIFGAARARKNWGSHLVTTGYEHPCVAKPLEALAEKEEFQLTIVPPEPTGAVALAAIVNEVRADTVLVSAMQVNNETGAVLDVAELARLVKAKNPRTAVHIDGVQGFTKLPVRLSETEIDSYGVSGHKIHAPKGIGALYLRKGMNIYPPLLGGGQENGLRPGTENTPYIAGFAKAVEIALQNRPKAAERIQQLRAQLLQGLQKLPGVVLNSPENSYGGIVNFSLPGLKSETLLHFLEEYGVYVSSGSACSKGQVSHTLAAMRLPKERAESALRVSFDAYNTPEDVEALLEGLYKGAASLARASGPRRNG